MSLHTERRIIRTEEVLEKTGIQSRVTLWRRVRDNSFPSPVEISDAPGRQIGWFSNEIEQWLGDRPRVNYAPRSADAEQPLPPKERIAEQEVRIRNSTSDEEDQAA